MEKAGPLKVSKKVTFAIFSLSIPLMLGIPGFTGPAQEAWAVAEPVADPIQKTAGQVPEAAEIPLVTPRAQSPAELNQLLRREIGSHGATMGGKNPQRIKQSFARATFAFVPNFGVLGSDVSSWQSNVNWDEEWNKGVRFTYIKATEATSYRNPYHSRQYNDSSRRGIIRGSYHFAIPNVSTGAAQANYFIDNGGHWKADGMTLPPLLDIEYNPYPSLGNACYDMSPGSMTAWIRDFSRTVQTRTGRAPAIYTTTDWWTRCTGNNGSFSDHPLLLASYATRPGRLPNGWSNFDFWQFSSSGPFAGDSSVYRGNIDDLRRFAAGNNDDAAIKEKYKTNRWVGNPTTGEICGLKNNGCLQRYANGVIYWSPATGAHIVRAGILSGYREANYENSPLGYPTTGEICGLKNNGCLQRFQGGNVYWTPTTGGHPIYGAIINTWASQGSENGVLGYPTTGEICGLKNNGCLQRYANGVIYWSPATGAHIVRAGILSGYREANYENSPLGYPTTGEICGLKNNGCLQRFQGGNVYWTPTTGGHPIYGAIINTWASQGSENGVLGYPTTGEICSGSENNLSCSQNFQGGTILWTPQRGAWKP